MLLSNDGYGRPVVSDALLYRFTFHTAFGVATAEPFGGTRWRFRTPDA